jgi:hypothetical protein
MPDETQNETTQTSDTAHVCPMCDETTEEELYFLASENLFICNTCRNDETFFCETCDTRLLNRYHAHYASAEICDTCFNEQHDNEEENDDNNEIPKAFLNISDLTKKDTANACGLELETLKKDNYTIKGFDFCNTLNGWRIDKDCSIKEDDGEDTTNGAEFVSPPFFVNKSNHRKRIRKAIKLIKDNARINNSCGYHAHFFIHENKINSKNIKKLFIAYMRAENFFYSLNPPSRQENVYCKKLTTEYKEETIKEKRKVFNVIGYYYQPYLKKNYRIKQKKDIPDGKYNEKRYFYVNFHSVFYRNTLEMRLHSGTLDYQKIINWLNINRNFLKYVLKNSTKLKDIEDLTDAKIKKICAGKHSELKAYIEERQQKFNEVIPNGTDQPTTDRALNANINAITEPLNNNTTLTDLTQLNREE